MAVTIGGVSVDITADSSGVARGMEAAKAAVRSGVDSIQGVLQSMQGYLLALGGGLSIAAFANMVKGSIDATAGLHDLSIQTGASVASLAAFRSVASTTPTTLEDIAAAMNKSSKSMAVANEESKGIGAAIKSLGLDFNTLKAMKPEDQMLAVAKAMNQFEDGTGKSAAAMAIYGKKGAEMLSFLKDLAEQSGTVTKKMTEQEVETKRVLAAMADDFGDNLNKIKKDGEAWKKDVAAGMLPALWELSEAFRQVTNGPGGLKAEISRLAADGSITAWTRNAITGLTYVMDTFEGFWVVVKSIAVGIGAALATVATAITTTFNVANQVLHGDFSGAIDSVKTGFRSVGSIGESVAGDISAAWGQQTLGSKFRDRLGDLQSVGYAAKKVKEDLKFSGGDGADAANKDLERQASLLSELSGLSKSFGKDWADLTALYQRGSLTVAQLEKAQAELLAKQPAIKAAHDETAKAIKREEDATKQSTEAHWKYLQGLDKSLEKTLEEIAAENQRTAQLGMSKEAIAALDVAKLDLMATELERQAIRNLDKNLDEAEYQAIMKQANAYRELGKAKANGARAELAAQEAKDTATWWKKAFDEIEKSLTDALINGFDKGKSIWDSLKDYIVNGAKSMVVRVLVQPVMGALSGLFGMGDAIGGTGGSGGGSGFLSGLKGIFGNLGSGFNAGLGSVFGEGGTMGGLSAGVTSLGAGNISGGLGTLAGAAAPWIAGLGLLKSLTDYKITPDGGGLTASLTSSGTSTGMVGQFNQFKQEGGLGGGGNTTNRSWSTADKGTTDYIINTVKANTEANKAYARSLGLNADAMDGYTKNIEINTSGMDAAAAQAAINGELATFAADQVSAAYGEAIKQFAMAGESASQTLQRLAMVQGTAQTLNEFGGIFSQIAAGGIEATQSMISLSGGIDKLIAKSAKFVELYYTSDEQNGINAKSILSQLNAAGVQDASGLSDKDEFRRLVESIDVTNEAGRRQLNALLDVGPQFAQIAAILDSQHIDLGTLAGLAPDIAALAPLFGGSGTSDAANATTASINATTDAVTAGTTAVVAAIESMAGRVSTALANAQAGTNAVLGNLATQMDTANTNNRLNMAGQGIGA